MAHTSLPHDRSELDAVLDRFIDFEKELLTLPRFDDRPATEQDRLRREYREHLEKLDAARAAAADPGTAAAEREHMLAGFGELFEAAGAGNTNAWELLVRVSEILGRWAEAYGYWEDMRNNLRPPKPKAEARGDSDHPQILADLGGLCSRAQYRDRDALRLVEEIFQIILPQMEGPT
jgi:hypothetical protein